ncbi:MAG: SRPBCC family protein [Armatimonadota bacterium]|nr:SRPBCC family protein [Armatimonadota bacterium]
MGTVVKEIIVNAPISRVFEFWKNFENFPRFMRHVESIQVIGPDLTHWKTHGPLGTAVEWDARTTYVEENKKIAWKSTGGTIETHGAVTFAELGPNQTKVTVGIEYTPPAGALGDAVAKLFSDPEKETEEDLQRFKEVVESGDDGATSGTTATGGETASPVV